MKFNYLVQLNAIPGKPHFRRPIVGITLYGPQKEILTDALIDSGADYCLFNIQYATYIGVNLKKCDKSKTTGVEGGIVDVFITDIYIKVNNLEKIKIPVGFIDSNSVNGLIGQIGFFDLNRIKFERDHNTFEITPKEK